LILFLGFPVLAVRSQKQIPDLLKLPLNAQKFVRQEKYDFMFSILTTNEPIIKSSGLFSLAPKCVSETDAFH
jgi:hypothetical protein